MSRHSESKLSWLTRWRERRRLKRERTTDSPERQDEHHTPKRDAVDMWLHSGGVKRRSRFKQ